METIQTVEPNYINIDRLSYLSCTQSEIIPVDQVVLGFSNLFIENRSNVTKDQVNVEIVHACGWFARAMELLQIHRRMRSQTTEQRVPKEKELIGRARPAVQARLNARGSDRRAEGVKRKVTIVYILSPRSQDGSSALRTSRQTARSLSQLLPSSLIGPQAVS